MRAILSVTFPFFALVLCGYLAVRRGLLPQLAIPGLNGFVLYFALPCMLFRFGSATPLARLLDARVFAVYLACALCMVALTLAGSRRAGLDWNNAAFGALVAALPNTGFMGVRLLLARGPVPAPDAASRPGAGRRRSRAGVEPGKPGGAGRPQETPPRPGRRQITS